MFISNCLYMELIFTVLVQILSKLFTFFKPKYNKIQKQE
jgi:hypothetical protein